MYNRNATCDGISFPCVIGCIDPVAHNLYRPVVHCNNQCNNLQNFIVLPVPFLRTDIANYNIRFSKFFQSRVLLLR